MRTHISAIVAALILFTTCVTRPLFADAPRGENVDPDASKKAKARGLALLGFEDLQRGDALRAIEHLTEAERLYHAVTIVLLLAQANERTGRVVEARSLYRSILNEDLQPLAPKEFLDAKADARRGFDALEGRFATLAVSAPGASSDDVTLTIDGSAASPVEAVHALNPGAHTITLAARSGASITRSVSLKAGDEERLVVPMASLDPYGSKAFLAPAAVAFGVGVLGLGAGVVTATLAMRDAADASSRCTSLRCSPSAAASAVSAGETLGVASTISFVVGSAGLATSAIWLYMGRPTGKSRVEAPSSVAPGARGQEPPAPATKAGIASLTIAATPVSLSIRGAF